MSDECTALLAKSRLFAGFSEAQLDEVITHLQPRQLKLKRGERLYKRGEPADRCWLIRSGTLTVKRASLRTPFRQMLYNQGAVTGIQGLADPGSERAVSMIADGKTELVEITQEGIAKLSPEAQIQLWQNVSRLLLHKLTACLSRESLD